MCAERRSKRRAQARFRAEQGAVRSASRRGAPSAPVADPRPRGSDQPSWISRAEAVESLPQTPFGPASPAHAIDLPLREQVGGCSAIEVATHAAGRVGARGLRADPLAGGEPREPVGASPRCSRPTGLRGRCRASGGTRASAACARPPRLSARGRPRAAAATRPAPRPRPGCRVRGERRPAAAARRRRSPGSTSRASGVATGGRLQSGAARGSHGRHPVEVERTARPPTGSAPATDAYRRSGRPGSREPEREPPRLGAEDDRAGRRQRVGGRGEHRSTRCPPSRRRP